MTNEYKNNVLRQLTGQVVEGTGEDRPIFNALTSGTDALNDYITSQGYSGNCTLDFSCTRNNKQILFYTEYKDDPQAVSTPSFIVITDMDLQPLGIIKQWSSGTAFRVFSNIINNDTGEGRIYFIDVDEVSYANPRIVYMNDPTVKKTGDTYKADMLSSVYISSITTNEFIWDFNKSENEGKFAIVSFNNQTNKIKLVEYINNVDTEDEWNIYLYATAMSGFSGDITIYPIWSENFDCRVCFVDATGDLCIKVLNTQQSGDTLSLVLYKTIFLPNELQEFTNDIKNIKMLNYNYIYGGTQGSFGDDTTSTFIEVNINQGNMKVLYTTEYYSTFYTYIVNNQVFFTKSSYVPSESGNVFTFGMIDKGKYYETNLTTSGYFMPLVFIINSFNLYSIRIVDEYGNVSTLFKYYLIYNPNDYNGNSFNGKASVVSNSVVLNDADGNPIFARNLYNKTILQNTVESTVEIPAYQLNEETIANQQLISKNNNKIINRTEDIEKNIYENVLLNFFNTLTIVDNNENKNKIMSNASSYFVEGMESSKYNDLSAIKVRTTYIDNSTHIGNIGDISITDNTATMVFAIYTGVGVSKVEIISNDELMTYATINENFDTNSYYKITQEVEII